MRFRLYSYASPFIKGGLRGISVLHLCLLCIVLLNQPVIAQTDKSSLAFFVGHSEWDKGATGINGIPQEWEYCEGVAEQLKKLAPNYGVTLKVFYRGNFTSYSKAMDDLWQRKNTWSKSAPAVECHYNITPEKLRHVQKNASVREMFLNQTPPQKGSLQGTWVLYQPNDVTRKIAERLLENILLVMPRVDEKSIDVSEIIPVAKGDRGGRMMLSPYAKAPAMLLEIGYADNPSEILLMQEGGFQEKLAHAILTAF